MDQKYKLNLAFTQSTDGREDNITSGVDGSDDPAIHLIKTKVWTKHLTAALEAITTELCDLGIAAVEQGSKPRGKK